MKPCLDMKGMIFRLFVGVFSPPGGGGRSGSDEPAYSGILSARATQGRLSADPPVST